jgi:hypothetical protein
MSVKGSCELILLSLTLEFLLEESAPTADVETDSSLTILVVAFLGIISPFLFSYFYLLIKKK